jgi:hypothetical protein
MVFSCPTVPPRRDGPNQSTTFPSLPVVAFSDLRGPQPRWRHLEMRDGIRSFCLCGGAQVCAAGPRARAPPSTTIASHASQAQLPFLSQGTRRT